MEQSKFYQIKNVTEHEYTLVGCDGSVITRPIQDVDKSASVFTIQDAKDGDILATLNDILIFKEFLPKDCGVSYCHYDFGCSTPQFNFNKDDNWYFGKEAIIHPATKEQRDQLEKAMADAGYTFDFEKKELKKIEKKSSWSEEDEKCIRLSTDIIDSALRAGFCVQLDRDRCVDWLKSIKERYTWKQSDWQMITLRHVISGCSYDIEPLVEIEEHLKKLREE